MIDYSLIPLDCYEEIPDGETVTAYDSTKYRGKDGLHEDIDLSSRNSPHLSGMLIRSRLVKNTSGTTIAKGRALKWTATKLGYGVQIAGAGDTPCGVAPYYVPADIPNGAWFSMIVHGPATVEKEAGECLEGARVVTAANGRCVDEAAGNYYNDLMEIGYALETSSGGTGTYQRVFVDIE